MSNAWTIGVQFSTSHSSPGAQGLEPMLATVKQVGEFSGTQREDGPNVTLDVTLAGPTPTSKSNNSLK